MVGVPCTDQTACELGQTQQMQQVLKVQPVRSFHHSVTRFEGPLLRQMRILGWRMVWVSLSTSVVGLLACCSSFSCFGFAF